MSYLNRRIQNRFILSIVRYLAAIIAIAAVTLLLRVFKLELANQVVVLIYLLPVVLGTVVWGLGPGILAAVLAFLTFNYYYIKPFYTFQVHATQDLILLIIFLIVAVVIAQLIGQARQGERLARSREWEATRLYGRTSELARLQSTRGVSETLAGQTLETFNCARVDLDIPEKADEPPFTAVAGEERSADPPAITCTLATARGYEGEMRLWLKNQKLSREEQRLLDAFTSQGALSMERIRLNSSHQKI